MGGSDCGGAARGTGGGFGTAGAGSPAETTGRSTSSSDPSAGGKSEGMGARCCAAGGATGALGTEAGGGFGAATGTFWVGAAMGIFCVGAAGATGAAGAAGAAAGTGGAMPTMVRCRFTPGGGGGGFGAPATAGAGVGAGGTAGAAAAGALGFVTRNECPHLGHRIFSPAGGTRRSSIWYGALHDSHSTLSIDLAIVSRAQVQTRFLPPRLARYMAWSAALKRASASPASPGMVATPQLSPGCTRSPSFS